MKILLTIALILLCGTLGRMGGTSLGTLWRDLGCPIVMLMATVLWFGWQPEHWLAYTLAGVATYGALTTYWDWLFGYDCMWFAGLCTGVAGLPLMWVAGDHWWLIVARIVVLAVVWEALNRFLPQKVFWWRRDVAEENMRYWSVV